METRKREEKIFQGPTIFPWGIWPELVSQHPVYYTAYRRQGWNVVWETSSRWLWKKEVGALPAFVLVHQV